MQKEERSAQEALANSGAEPETARRPDYESEIISII